MPRSTDTTVAVCGPYGQIPDLRVPRSYKTTTLYCIHTWCKYSASSVDLQRAHTLLEEHLLYDHAARPSEWATVRKTDI